MLVANSGRPNLTGRQVVRDTGQLQQFDTPSSEQDLGVRFGVDDEYLSAFSEGPAIKANQVQRMRGGETTTRGR